MYQQHCFSFVLTTLQSVCVSVTCSRAHHTTHTRHYFPHTPANSLLVVDCLPACLPVCQSHHHTRQIVCGVLHTV